MEGPSDRDDGNEKVRVIKPEVVILSAFDYFQTRTLNLNSLIVIGLSAGADSADAVQGVLAKMCEEGSLVWEQREGVVLFTRVDVPNRPGPKQ